MDKVKERIKKHEGFRDTIYKDSLGFATIGYGHLVKESDSFEENVQYPQEMLESIFEDDYNIALDGANVLIESNLGSHQYKALPQKKKNIIKGVIVEMVFQLGVAGVGKFRNMFSNLDECNFEEASNEMQDSLWYEQTKSRCKKLSGIIKDLK
tara:strand:+ start:335 stop:793 length:459 start_codon:yes stop_codon:yes gene_type:complete